MIQWTSLNALREFFKICFNPPHMLWKWKNTKRWRSCERDGKLFATARGGGGIANYISVNFFALARNSIGSVFACATEAPRVRESSQSCRNWDWKSLQVTPLIVCGTCRHRALDSEMHTHTQEDVLVMVFLGENIVAKQCYLTWDLGCPVSTVALNLLGKNAQGRLELNFLFRCRDVDLENKKTFLDESMMIFSITDCHLHSSFVSFSFSFWTSIMTTIFCWLDFTYVIFKCPVYYNVSKLRHISGCIWVTVFLVDQHNTEVVTWLHHSCQDEWYWNMRFVT